MADGLWQSLRMKFRTGSTLLQLVYINVGIFVVLHLVGIVAMLANVPMQDFLSWVQLPAAPVELLHSPWTVITYMFTHDGLWHLTFNMLMLYSVGILFYDYFTQRQLVGLYIIGGLAGALTYMVGYGVFPHLIRAGAGLVGASASVLAIVIAICVQAPRRKVGFVLLGAVELRWIGIGIVLLDLLSMNENVGGHFAHIGGIVAGYLYVKLYAKGIDITHGVNSVIDFMVNLKRVVGRRPATRATNQGEVAWSEDELDSILVKLKQSGYQALSEDERAYLFRAPRKK